MTLDPKAMAFARDLGALLACYVPEAREGHNILELLGSVQDGINSGSIPEIRLPLRTAMPVGRTDPSFDLNAPRGISIILASSMVALVTNDVPVKSRRNPKVLAWFDKEGHLLANVSPSTGKAVTIAMTRDTADSGS